LEQSHPYWIARGNSFGAGSNIHHILRGGTNNNIWSMKGAEHVVMRKCAFWSKEIVIER